MLFEMEKVPPLLSAQRSDSISDVRAFQPVRGTSQPSLWLVATLLDPQNENAIASPFLRFPLSSYPFMLTRCKFLLRQYGCHGLKASIIEAIGTCIPMPLSLHE